jgi:hypothetical protein
MTRRGRQAIALGAMAASLAAPADAAANHARIDYRDAFTTRTPGAPTGRLYTVDFFAATDANAKPPPLEHVHLVLPEGARFNTEAIPQCTATDVQLIAQGPEACPRGSRLGTGVLTIDTGFPEPNRFSPVDLTGLNARNTLIIFSQDRETGARVIVRAPVGERTLDIDVPPLPGAPPEGGADRREEITFEPVTGPGGAYVTTPPTCPADGAWVLRTTYTFRGGEQQTAESRSPCDASGREPAQRITFFRRQRAQADRGGQMRLRSRRETSATIAIARGGQVLRRQRVRLREGLNRVELPALGRGRYSLTVTSAGATRRATLIVR